MPLIIEWTYADSTREVDRIGVNVWRKNEQKVVKTFMKNKEVVAIRLDPYRETADIDEKNNVWPNVAVTSKFQLFKSNGARNPRGARGGNNPMQKQIKE